MAAHIKKGDIVDFCTGSGGDFILKFRKGYPDADIENDYNIVINQDIKDYFNSYWFLELKGFYNGTNVILEPVIPGKELNNFIQQLQGYYMIYNELSYIPIGFEANNNNLIVVNNADGRVYFDDLERKEKVYVAESLKEFISKISFKR